ncbi:MAG TPA: Na+/H+ antiporter subunit A, partial [Actinomycetales bacterium]|nr:Na+/H+ antiporter subunit A [Actinomycetales bacterium]
WIMLLVVGAIGALVMIYCAGYFRDTEPGLGRFASVLTAFAGSMIGLVVADDVLVLYVFWELTTICSYLLIGHLAESKDSRRAAMQAIIVTTAGGLAMLVGLLMLAYETGTMRLSEIIAAGPELSGTYITVAIVLILFGALSKSAFVPTHFWLPSAMAAPTPVSAYLHAAAMVKAGVYLVARLAPGFAHLIFWQILVLGLGCATLLIGGWRALRQTDIKVLLAYGTVSQLGLITVLVGAGVRGLALAGLGLLVAHALFKSALFLTVGVIEHATGTRDVRRLSGVGKKLPALATAAAIAAASMAGIPPLLGFAAKESALEGLLTVIGGGSAPFAPLAAWALLIFIGLGSAFTLAYAVRFWWGTFGVLQSEKGADGIIEPTEVAPPNRLTTYPVYILAAATALISVLVHALSGPAESFAAQFAHGAPASLGLWHGFGPALLVSAVIIACGAGLAAASQWVERAQERFPDFADAELVYRRNMRRLDRFAGMVTGATQRGSLPLNIGVILLVFVAMGVWVIARHDLLPSDVYVWDSPAQLTVTLLVIAGAIMAARARHRIKAVLLVGVTGYGSAVIFVLHGAPDLALTQVLVETVTLVVFILVLRRLSPYFSNRPLATSRWVRLAVGAGVGVVVTILALAAPLGRVHAPQSQNFPEAAMEFGHGANVVNVTLVDIRAWDTMGEISVLLAAATGVASLIFLRQRSGEVLRSWRAGDAKVWSGGFEGSPLLRKDTSKFRDWIAAASTMAPQRRSVIFEVATRLIFHTVIIFSIFLLFSGHNKPGGGFAGGLVAGLALIIRYLAGGRYELGEAAPLHPGILLGTGLFLSAGVGLAGIALGQQALRSTMFSFELPVFGEVHLVTSLFFDIGVYLVVIGVVLDILRSLGAEIDRLGEREGATPVDLPPAGGDA